MMAKEKNPSPLAKVLPQTAGDMRKAGLLDKITLRHLDPKDTPKVEPIPPKRMRAMCERANMSQAEPDVWLPLAIGGREPNSRPGRLSRSSTLSSARESQQFCNALQERRQRRGDLHYGANMDLMSVVAETAHPTSRRPGLDPPLTQQSIFNGNPSHEIAKRVRVDWPRKAHGRRSADAAKDMVRGRRGQ
jgi:putative transcriptional regulator